MRLDRAAGRRSSATGVAWVVAAALGLSAVALALAGLIAWLT
jgi:hypothetical protein